MTNFLQLQTIFAAVGVAFVFCVLPGLPAAIRALKIPPAPGADTGPFVSGLSGICLMPLIALMSFPPALIAIWSTARIMGFGPNVSHGTIPNGDLLLWTLLVPFLWLQVRYVMGLRGFWVRCRYLCVLVILPLVAQTLLWLAQDYACGRGMLDFVSLSVVNDWARLLSLGVLPYLMPVIHKRALAPTFNWASGLAPDRRRPAVVRIGNALFAVTVVALFALFGSVQRTIGVHQSDPGIATHTKFTSVGPPHVCLGDYPALSLRLGEQGTTVLAFHITAAGGVKDVSVVQSSGSDRLDLAAVTCVTRWSYVPANRNGRNLETPWKVKIVWEMH